MIPFLFLYFIATLKVFKKTTPNGKVTVYVGKRDFIDHLDSIDPIDGVVVVENDYLQGRKVFGMVSTTYRYGRDEDEVMGVKFSKEMVLDRNQIVPPIKEVSELTPIQKKLMKKFGSSNAFPFVFHFPANSPSSVTLQPGDDDSGKPLGVEYNIRTYVSDQEDDRGNQRSTIVLAIKKLQYAPPTRGQRLPSSLISKGFTFSHGKISLEVTLDREIYYHGEKVVATIVVSNSSRKSVKNIKVYVVQHTEITMVNAQFSKFVASLETREGCPITPGAAFTKQFYLVPVASSNKDRRGIALDGRLKDDDVNLASSTLISEGRGPSDQTGIVISYSVRVKLNCGTLGGELVTDVPFKLMHPNPASNDSTVQPKQPQKGVLKKMKSSDRMKYQKSFADDDEDNIVFEDFARLRLADE
ncbi:Arrestin,Arrestin-like, N-terminal,Arrestin, N-terminal,Arrestin, conserved site,Immunoglobulin E- [Cinara cedri]|uniref:Arrestin,Arrestin-like, N-terminal,Arrestin, N-terminal,Arrestin, conserved site,Immunoglobulin E n=1 Tax=Cinara cedri TaxID=506608 RepID=A0A5E4MQD6_9HEMI|nr:Arrestin,Arrestin-like, N-terminal,Arrestin, N-terminal,Arrestin, conserved site,Immunoglobulin E- [Cinara cedri]